jgi:hypothetical protein
MVPIRNLVMSLGLFVAASAMLVGCEKIHWSDKDKGPETQPKVTSPAPAPANKPVTAAPAPTPAAVKAIRVKAGVDAPYTDKAGNVWAADTGFDGGETVSRDASLAVTGTNDPEMYRTERYSMAGYTFNVPNGKYKVNLYFAETYDGITGPGERIFSFSVQGKEHKDFDIWKEAGGFAKVKVVSEDVTVTNGKIEIKFTANVQNPCVDAIEIIPS